MWISFIEGGADEEKMLDLGRGKTVSKTGPGVVWRHKPSFRG